MTQLSQSDKERLLSFIKDNDLDFSTNENIVTKFHTTAYDGIKFFFYTLNEEYVIVKYDKNKDNGNPASMPYEYFNFKTLGQVLEQLSFYDNSLHKTYWETTANSIEIGFDKDNYNEEWYKDFIKDEYYVLEDTNIIYNNSNYKPELKSPYNTLHEVSLINNETYTKVDKLYFEIHPISCMVGNESYLLKLACNNDEIFKEYINYKVYSKKGLRLLIENIFAMVKPFKI